MNWIAIGEEYEGYSAFGAYGSWYLIPYAHIWLLSYNSPHDQQKTPSERFSRFEDAQAHAQKQEAAWQATNG